MSKKNEAGNIVAAAEVTVVETAAVETKPKSEVNYAAKAASKLKKRLVEKPEPKAEVAVAEKPTTEKPAEKKLVKPAATKKAEPTEAEKAQKAKEAIVQMNQTPLAQMFPAEIQHETLGKLKLNADCTSMEAVRKLAIAGTKLVFAFWWTRRHLKQFTYDAVLHAPKNGFPNDLDMAQPIYLNDENKVLYVVSRYTSRIYAIFPENLLISEDDNMRFLNGCEYALYEIVEVPAPAPATPAAETK